MQVLVVLLLVFFSFRSEALLKEIQNSYQDLLFNKENGYCIREDGEVAAAALMIVNPNEHDPEKYVESAMNIPIPNEGEAFQVNYSPITFSDVKDSIPRAAVSYISSGKVEVNLGGRFIFKVGDEVYRSDIVKSSMQPVAVDCLQELTKLPDAKQKDLNISKSASCLQSTNSFFIDPKTNLLTFAERVSVLTECYASTHPEDTQERSCLQSVKEFDYSYENVLNVSLKSAEPIAKTALCSMPGPGSIFASLAFKTQDKLKGDGKVSTKEIVDMATGKECRDILQDAPCINDAVAGALLSVYDLFKFVSLGAIEASAASITTVVGTTGRIAQAAGKGVENTCGEGTAIAISLQDMAEKSDDKIDDYSRLSDEATSLQRKAVIGFLTSTESLKKSALKSISPSCDRFGDAGKFLGLVTSPFRAKKGESKSQAQELVEGGALSAFNFAEDLYTGANEIENVSSANNQMMLNEMFQGLANYMAERPDLTFLIANPATQIIGMQKLMVDIANLIVNMFKSIANNYFGCEQWEGVPYGPRSECVKPFNGECASCKSYINRVCGVASYFLSNPFAMAKAVGALSKVAKASKLLKGAKTTVSTFKSTLGKITDDIMKGTGIKRIPKQALPSSARKVSNGQKLVETTKAKPAIVTRVSDALREAKKIVQGKSGNLVLIHKGVSDLRKLKISSGAKKLAKGAFGVSGATVDSATRAVTRTLLKTTANPGRNAVRLSGVSSVRGALSYAANLPVKAARKIASTPLRAYEWGNMRIRAISKYGVKEGVMIDKYRLLKLELEGAANQLESLAKKMGFKPDAPELKAFQTEMKAAKSAKEMKLIVKKYSRMGIEKKISEGADNLVGEGVAASNSGAVKGWARAADSPVEEAMWREFYELSNRAFRNEQKLARLEYQYKIEKVATLNAADNIRTRMMSLVTGKFLKKLKGRMPEKSFDDIVNLLEKNLTDFRKMQDVNKTLNTLKTEDLTSKAIRDILKKYPEKSLDEIVELLEKESRQILEKIKRENPEIIELARSQSEVWRLSSLSDRGAQPYLRKTSKGRGVEKVTKASLDDFQDTLKSAWKNATKSELPEGARFVDNGDGTLRIEIQSGENVDVVQSLRQSDMDLLNRQLLEQDSDIFFLQRTSFDELEQAAPAYYADNIDTAFRQAGATRSDLLETTVDDFVNGFERIYESTGQEGAHLLDTIMDSSGAMTTSTIESLTSNVQSVGKNLDDLFQKAIGNPQGQANKFVERFVSENPFFTHAVTEQMLWEQIRGVHVGLGDRVAEFVGYSAIVDKADEYRKSGEDKASVYKKDGARGSAQNKTSSPNKFVPTSISSPGSKTTPP